MNRRATQLCQWSASRLDPALSCDRRNTSAMMTDLDAEEMGWGNESITGTD